LICKPSTAVERLVDFCSQQAIDMAADQLPLREALGEVRARREVTAAELDEAAATILARRGAPFERFGVASACMPGNSYQIGRPLPATSLRPELLSG
jgi:hypothetical protein